ncbi:MAG: thiamine pyrophosphate-dependent enzyme [Myxococcota bacterium]|nr:thiamine pyrophosphate-dependent enzyme [Myxococcota bacterium]
MSSSVSLEVRTRLRDLSGVVTCLDRELERLAGTGEIGTVSLSGVGRSAMLGAGLALESDDFLFGTARDLPAALARGVSLDSAFSQILSQAGDPSLGRGLPGAYNQLEARTALSDGNVGSHLVHACGYGLAARLRGAPSVALGLFGNAAQSNGEIHGALNFAGVYEAQVIFVARGRLGDAVPFEEAAKAWGIPVETVPGDSAVAVYEAVLRARGRAISGDGPTIVDARLSGDWTPRDAEILQGLLGHDGGETETVRNERYHNEVHRAIRAAQEGGSVPEETMLQGLFTGPFAQGTEIRGGHGP